MQAKFFISLVESYKVETSSPYYKHFTSGSPTLQETRSIHDSINIPF